MSLEIYPILCNAGFMDNYAYVLIDSETKVSAVVDAAEEKPIVEFCQWQQPCQRKGHPLQQHQPYLQQGGPENQAGDTGLSRA